MARQGQLCLKTEGIETLVALCLSAERIAQTGSSFPPLCKSVVGNSGSNVGQIEICDKPQRSVQMVKSNPNSVVHISLVFDSVLSTQ